jgi:hypothetical protein
LHNSGVDRAIPCWSSWGHTYAQQIVFIFTVPLHGEAVNRPEENLGILRTSKQTAHNVIGEPVR